jgi:hypothetical protein
VAVVVAVTVGEDDGQVSSGNMIEETLKALVDTQAMMANSMAEIL